MSMSAIAICNLALKEAGGNAIASLSEQSEEALLCSLFYEPCIDHALRGFKWSFATKIKPLAVVAGAEVPGWDYIYAHPADCLAPRKIIREEGAQDTPPKFQVMASDSGTQKLICTNEPQAWLEYTARITDPAQFDSQFIMALVYRLAADLVTPLTGEPARREGLLQIFSAFLQEAQATSANEQPDRPSFTRYVDARR